MDVQTLATGLAANIEARGHYQGDAEGAHRDGKCCIVVNPAWDSTPWTVREEFTDLLGEKIGLPKIKIEDDEVVDLQGIYDWNDTTDTQEVLDTLRSIG